MRKPLLLTLSLGALSACGSEKGNDSASSGAAWFEDVGAASGAALEHDLGADQRRYWIPEITGSGLGLFDADGDGDLDLFVCQGGRLEDGDPAGSSDALLLNDGTGRFTDVTREAGIDDRLFGMGCAAADYDGDGDVDLFVTNVGRNVLWRNDGDGTFTDATDAAGLREDAWSTSAAFLDYDGDGDLDLFHCNYIRWSSSNEVPCSNKLGEPDYCHPNNYDAPDVDRLWRNEGDGTFTDVTEASGIAKVFGNGLGVAWGDLTGDGLVDIYVANDGMANQLWVNRGSGRFQDQALAKGCALSGEGKAEAGMGVLLEDLDGDLRLDLFVTHLRSETNTFYRSRSRRFADDTRRTGTVEASLNFTAFGVGAADFDHDGDLDYYVANGRVGDATPRFSEDRVLAEPDQLFRGSGDGTFTEVLPRGGTATELPTIGRGAAFGDLDGDGDVDVVVTDNGGTVRVLRNVAPKRGTWLQLDLREADGSTALGARVTLQAGGRKQLRQVQTAYSYCATNDPRVHFGVPEGSSIEGIQVQWADGTIEEVGLLEPGRLHTVRRSSDR